MQELFTDHPCQSGLDEDYSSVWNMFIHSVLALQAWLVLSWNTWHWYQKTVLPHYAPHSGGLSPEQNCKDGPEHHSQIWIDEQLFSSRHVSSEGSTCMCLKSGGPEQGYLRPALMMIKAYPARCLEEHRWAPALWGKIVNKAHFPNPYIYGRKRSCYLQLIEHLLRAQVLFWHALMDSEIVKSWHRFSRTSTLTRAYCLMVGQAKASLSASTYKPIMCWNGKAFMKLKRRTTITLNVSGRIILYM